MGEKRKNAELPENFDNPDPWDNLKCKNGELEVEKLALKARILELETTNKDLEQEIRQFKENCTCPKDTAGDFRIVPLLAMRKIFEFLSFDDLKELRCVSSWFFTIVSDEFKSVFGTYHMKMHSEVSDACSDTGKKWKLQVPKEIDDIKRPGVELAFNLELGDAYEDMGKPDADFVQEVLKYKNNITGIKVALCHDSCDYLLKEDFYFKHLERIDIFLVVCKSEDCHNEHSNFVKEVCINFISRYANQIEHFEISDLNDWYVDSNGNDLPHMPNIRSLSLQRSDASFLIKPVNFENVTKLELRTFSDRVGMKDLNIRNLSVLSLDGVDEEPSVMLLKNNSSTLTELYIDFTIIEDYEIDFKEIKFSKLKQLYIGEMYETDALTIIENSKNTLEEIHLCGRPFGHKTLESVSYLQLPCLKKVHLNNQHRFVSSNLLLSLISACNDNAIILIDGKTINKSMLELIRGKIESEYDYLLK